MIAEVTFGKTLKREQLKYIKEYKKFEKKVCDCNADVRITIRYKFIFSKWEIRCAKCDKLFYKTFKLFWR